MSTPCAMRPDPLRYAGTFPPGACCIAARGHGGSKHCTDAVDGALAYFEHVRRDDLNALAGPVVAAVRELAHVTGLSIESALDLVREQMRDAR